MSLIKKPTTEMMQVANRANSLKSTGPVTEAGKMNVRTNGLRHGMRAKGLRYVFETLGENRHGWFDLRIQFFQLLKPRNVVEYQLTEQIVENRWRRLRVRQSEDGMLAARRLQFERDYARKLADEGRSPESVGQAAKAQNEGLVALEDSGSKFAFILQCLRAVRQAVEKEGFGEQGWKRLEAVYGPNPGLAGAALLANYRECQKAASEPEASRPAGEDRNNQKQTFLTRLDADISCFEQLHELHQVSSDRLAEAQVDALSVLPRQELGRILEYETFLDRQFERLLKQYSAYHPGWQEQDPSNTRGDSKAATVHCDKPLRELSNDSAGKEKEGKTASPESEPPSVDLGPQENSPSDKKEVAMETRVTDSPKNSPSKAVRL
jgi:hypothetical protein